MEYKTYKIRWAIIGGLVICSFIRGYFPLMFAMSNDVVVRYLNVTPYQVDVLASVDSASAVAVCILFAFIGEGIGLKMMSVATTGFFAVCCIAIAVGFVKR